ncbi:MAG: type II toxin-antitoxin system HicA family toxin [Bauldia sp.]|nr:type II toxin-antitoxin system HicA family toxin [Bauldia sp.]
MPTKVKDAIRTIEQDGWFLVGTRGSHRQFKHLSKAGRVAISGKAIGGLVAGNVEQHLKQAGIKERT